ncbi:Pogo transposable element-like 16, partial [Homarus americanus]
DIEHHTPAAAAAPLRTARHRTPLLTDTLPAPGVRHRTHSAAALPSGCETPHAPCNNSLQRTVDAASLLTATLPRILNHAHSTAATTDTTPLNNNYLTHSGCEHPHSLCCMPIRAVNATLPLNSTLPRAVDTTSLLAAATYAASGQWTPHRLNCHPQTVNSHTHSAQHPAQTQPDTHSSAATLEAVRRHSHSLLLPYPQIADVPLPSAATQAEHHTPTQQLPQEQPDTTHSSPTLLSPYPPNSGRRIITTLETLTPHSSWQHASGLTLASGLWCHRTVDTTLRICCNATPDNGRHHSLNAALPTRTWRNLLLTFFHLTHQTVVTIHTRNNSPYPSDEHHTHNSNCLASGRFHTPLNTLPRAVRHHTPRAAHLGLWTRSLTQQQLPCPSDAHSLLTALLQRAGLHHTHSQQLHLAWGCGHRIPPNNNYLTLGHALLTASYPSDCETPHSPLNNYHPRTPLLLTTPYHRTVPPLLLLLPYPQTTPHSHSAASALPDCETPHSPLFLPPDGRRITLNNCLASDCETPHSLCQLPARRTDGHHAPSSLRTSRCGHHCLGLATLITACIRAETPLPLLLPSRTVRHPAPLLTANCNIPSSFNCEHTPSACMPPRAVNTHSHSAQRPGCGHTLLLPPSGCEHHTPSAAAYPRAVNTTLPLCCWVCFNAVPRAVRLRATLLPLGLWTPATHSDCGSTHLAWAVDATLPLEIWLLNIRSMRRHSDATSSVCCLHSGCERRTHSAFHRVGGSPSGCEHRTPSSGCALRALGLWTPRFSMWAPVATCRSAVDATLTNAALPSDCGHHTHSAAAHLASGCGRHLLCCCFATRAVDATLMFLLLPSGCETPLFLVSGCETRSSSATCLRFCGHQFLVVLAARAVFTSSQQQLNLATRTVDITPSALPSGCGRRITLCLAWGCGRPLPQQPAAIGLETPRTFHLRHFTLGTHLALGLWSHSLSTAVYPPACEHHTPSAYTLGLCTPHLPAACLTLDCEHHTPCCCCQGCEHHVTLLLALPRAVDTTSSAFCHPQGCDTSLCCCYCPWGCEHHSLCACPQAVNTTLPPLRLPLRREHHTPSAAVPLGCGHHTYLSYAYLRFVDTAHAAALPRSQPALPPGCETPLRSALQQTDTTLHNQQHLALRLWTPHSLCIYLTLRTVNTTSLCCTLDCETPHSSAALPSGCEHHTPSAAIPSLGVDTTLPSAALPSGCGHHTPSAATLPSGCETPHSLCCCTLGLGTTPSAAIPSGCRTPLPLLPCPQAVDTTPLLLTLPSGCEHHLPLLLHSGCEPPPLLPYPQAVNHHLPLLLLPCPPGCEHHSLCYCLTPQAAVRHHTPSAAAAHSGCEHHTPLLLHPPQAVNTTLLCCCPPQAVNPSSAAALPSGCEHHSCCLLGCEHHTPLLLPPQAAVNTTLLLLHPPGCEHHTPLLLLPYSGCDHSSAAALPSGCEHHSSAATLPSQAAVSTTLLCCCCHPQAVSTTLPLLLPYPPGCEHHLPLLLPTSGCRHHTPLLLPYPPGCEHHLPLLCLPSGCEHHLPLLLLPSSGCETPHSLCCYLTSGCEHHTPSAALPQAVSTTPSAATLPQAVDTTPSAACLTPQAVNTTSLCCSYPQAVNTTLPPAASASGCELHLPLLLPYPQAAVDTSLCCLTSGCEHHTPLLLPYLQAVRHLPLLLPPSGCRHLPLLPQAVALLLLPYPQAVDTTLPLLLPPLRLWTPPPSAAALPSGCEHHTPLLLPPQAAVTPLLLLPTSGCDTSLCAASGVDTTLLCCCYLTLQAVRHHSLCCCCPSGCGHHLPLLLHLTLSVNTTPATLPSGCEHHTPLLLLPRAVTPHSLCCCSLPSGRHHLLCCYLTLQAVSTTLPLLLLPYPQAVSTHLPLLLPYPPGCEHHTPSAAATFPQAVDTTLPLLLLLTLRLHPSLLLPYSGCEHHSSAALPSRLNTTLPLLLLPPQAVNTTPLLLPYPSGCEHHLPLLLPYSGCEHHCCYLTSRLLNTTPSAATLPQAVNTTSLCCCLTLRCQTPHSSAATLPWAVNTTLPLLLPYPQVSDTTLPLLPALPQAVSTTPSAAALPPSGCDTHSSAAALPQAVSTTLPLLLPYLRLLWPSSAAALPGAVNTTLLCCCPPQAVNTTLPLLLLPLLGCEHHTPSAAATLQAVKHHTPLLLCPPQAVNTTLLCCCSHLGCRHHTPSAAAALTPQAAVNTTLPLLLPYLQAVNTTLLSAATPSGCRHHTPSAALTSRLNTTLPLLLYLTLSGAVNTSSCCLPSGCATPSAAATSGCEHHTPSVLPYWAVNLPPPLLLPTGAARLHTLSAWALFDPYSSAWIQEETSSRKVQAPVIEYEQTNSCAAAREFKLMPKTKCANGGKCNKWPQVEVEVACVSENRQNGYDLSSHGWCTRFMKRNDFVLRQRTKISQSQELDDKVIEFHRFIIKHRRRTHIDLCIGNMDETPMNFDMPVSQTVNKVSEKTVLVKTTEHEKSRFTVGLSCMADSTKLMPMHEKGWMDEGAYKIWLKVWNFRPGTVQRKKSSCVGYFRSHLVDSLIPGGLTSLVQPLDVSINKPFKDVRVKWNSWMISSTPSPSTVEAWDTIRPEMRHNADTTLPLLPLTLPGCEPPHSLCCCLPSGWLSTLCCLTLRHMNTTPLLLLPYHQAAVDSPPLPLLPSTSGLNFYLPAAAFPQAVNTTLPLLLLPLQAVDTTLPLLLLTLQAARLNTTPSAFPPSNCEHHTPLLLPPGCEHHTPSAATLPSGCEHHFLCCCLTSGREHPSAAALPSGCEPAYSLCCCLTSGCEHHTPLLLPAPPGCEHHTPSAAALHSVLNLPLLTLPLSSCEPHTPLPSPPGCEHHTPSAATLPQAVSTTPLLLPDLQAVDTTSLCSPQAGLFLYLGSEHSLCCALPGQLPDTTPLCLLPCHHSGCWSPPSPPAASRLPEHHLLCCYPLPSGCDTTLLCCLLPQAVNTTLLCPSGCEHHLHSAATLPSQAVTHLPSAATPTPPTPHPPPLPYPQTVTTTPLCCPQAVNHTPSAIHLPSDCAPNTPPNTHLHLSASHALRQLPPPSAACPPPGCEHHPSLCCCLASGEHHTPSAATLPSGSGATHTPSNYCPSRAVNTTSSAALPQAVNTTLPLLLPQATVNTHSSAALTPPDTQTPHSLCCYPRREPPLLCSFLHPQAVNTSLCCSTLPPRLSTTLPTLLPPPGCETPHSLCLPLPSGCEHHLSAAHLTLRLQNATLPLLLLPYPQAVAPHSLCCYCPPRADTTPLLLLPYPQARTPHSLCCYLTLPGCDTTPSAAAALPSGNTPPLGCETPHSLPCPQAAVNTTLHSAAATFLRLRHHTPLLLPSRAANTHSLCCCYLTLRAVDTTLPPAAFPRGCEHHTPLCCYLTSGCEHHTPSAALPYPQAAVNTTLPLLLPYPRAVTPHPSAATLPSGCRHPSSAALHPQAVNTTPLLLPYPRADTTLPLLLLPYPRAVDTTLLCCYPQAVDTTLLCCYLTLGLNHPPSAATLPPAGHHLLCCLPLRLWTPPPSAACLTLRLHHTPSAATAHPPGCEHHLPSALPYPQAVNTTLPLLLPYPRAVNTTLPLLLPYPPGCEHHTPSAATLPSGCEHHTPSAATLPSGCEHHLPLLLLPYPQAVDTHLPLLLPYPRAAVNTTLLCCYCTLRAVNTTSLCCCPQAVNTTLPLLPTLPSGCGHHTPSAATLPSGCEHHTLLCYLTSGCEHHTPLLLPYPQAEHTLPRLTLRSCGHHLPSAAFPRRCEHHTPSAATLPSGCRHPPPSAAATLRSCEHHTPSAAAYPPGCEHHLPLLLPYPQAVNTHSSLLPYPQAVNTTLPLRYLTPQAVNTTLPLLLLPSLRL